MIQMLFGLPGGGSIVGGGGGGGSGDTVQAMSFSLSGAGRLGFYVDYSESTDATGPVTHTFYVCRTHGTSGAVSCSYATSGDTHTTVSGTLSWADGEADIKSFTATVSAANLTTHSNNGLGEHRIIATLSSPTGSALLHRGSYTRAYGVIDDNSTMIASDSNAIFIDFDAVSNGDGTQASPYNNWYDARDAWGLTSPRYIYGKGTAIPDGTDTRFGRSVFDEEGANGHLNGTDTENPLIIRNWPGNTWTVTADASPKTGFFFESGCHYTVMKSIAFDGLTTAGTAETCEAIHFGSGQVNSTIEHCTFANFTSGAGSSTAAVKTSLGGGTLGCNLWRCTFNEIRKEDATAMAGIEQYDSSATSINRCEFYDCFIYEKDAPADATLPGLTVRFCITDAWIQMESQGSNNYGNFHIIQGNLFTDGGDFSNTDHVLWYRFRNSAPVGVDHWEFGNVFVNRGGSNLSIIRSDKGVHDDHININNIYYQGQGFWRLDDLPTSFKYCDYNHGFNVTSVGTWLYWYQDVSYDTYADMNSAIGFDSNADIGSNDPSFTDLVNDDVTLQAGSPCLGTGVGGTDKGVYLTGVETLGA